jgi:membrane protease YdiL (CAAX protease family)
MNAASLALAEPQPLAQVRVRFILAVFALLFLVELVLAGILREVGWVPSHVISRLISKAVGAALVGGFAWWTLWWRPIARRAVGFVPVSLRSCWLGAGLGALVMLFRGAVIGLQVFGPPSTQSSFGSTILALQVLDHGFADFLSPLVEETMFRGFLLAAATVYFGRWGAALLTTVGFVMMHYNVLGSPIASTSIFFFSLIATWLRLWSGSLLPAFAAHIAANIVTDLLGIIL